MNTSIRLILLCLLALSVGCTPIKSEDARFNSMSAKAIYKEASLALKKGRYNDAINGYEALLAHYPFGPYAEKAQFDIIDAYVKHGDVPSGMAAADHYIKLHPTSERIDGVYFKKGEALISQNQFMIQRLIKFDLSKRDNQPLFEALSSYRRIVDNYPKSPYLEKARSRVNELEGMLAKNSLDAARYYYKRHAYIAVINRAQSVIKHYPESQSAKAALALLDRSYKRLGLPDKAIDKVAD